MKSVKTNKQNLNTNVTQIDQLLGLENKPASNKAYCFIFILGNCIHPKYSYKWNNAECCTEYSQIIHQNLQIFLSRFDENSCVQRVEVCTVQDAQSNIWTIKVVPPIKTIWPS